MGLYIALGIVLLILIIRIVILEKQNARMKYNYESKILDILGDVKEIENKYATSGTEMCRYLEKTIAEHSRKYYKLKNELNIDDDVNV